MSESNAAHPRLLTCPVCRRPAAAASLMRPLAPPVTELLRADAGQWDAEDGACPRCVQPAVDNLLREGNIGFGRGDLPSPDQPAVTLGAMADRTLADPSCRGRGVTVAVVDAGFFPHPDLVTPTNRIRGHAISKDKEQELRLFDEAGPQPWPDRTPPSPRSWHGLMTSCALAGNGAISGGHYAGLAPESQLFLVRIGTKAGKIGDRQIAGGLRLVASLAERLQVRVVNLSVGGDRSIPNLRSSVNRLVRRLTRAGVTVVAAIGNSGQRLVVPPASSPEAITVGGFDDRNSLDPQDWRAWHSNYGPTFDGVAKPDLLAQSLWVPAPILPHTAEDAEAGLIDSLLPHDHDGRVARLEQAPPHWRRWAEFSATGLERWLRRRQRALKLVHRGYQHVDGTSFAAPLVSGAVACMLEEDSGLTPSRIKRILRATALPLEGVPTAQQGAGVLRAGPAVAYVRRSRYFRSGGPSPQLDGRRITFHLFAPLASAVRLHAEWRDWDPQGIDFVRIAGPVWRLSLPLPPAGRWRYRFEVDGERWVRDPENPRREPDGHGEWNSTVQIP